MSDWRDAATAVLATEAVAHPALPAYLVNLRILEALRSGSEQKTIEVIRIVKSVLKRARKCCTRADRADLGVVGNKAGLLLSFHGAVFVIGYVRILSKTEKGLRYLDEANPSQLAYHLFVSLPYLCVRPHSTL